MIKEPPQAKVAIGAVVRAHGLKGELVVHRFNDDTELLEAGQVLWLEGDALGGRWVEVLARSGDRVQLSGVQNRTSAEGLRGAQFSVDRSELPPAAKDEAYLVDLLGYQVVDAAGRKLGMFEGVLTSGNREFFVVKGAGEVLLPAEAPAGEPPIVAGINAAERTFWLSVEVDPDEEIVGRRGPGEKQTAGPKKKRQR